MYVQLRAYLIWWLRRGEVLEESCLRCHSKPESAPADLIKQYGPERSFGRKSGEVVSAISIRVPLSSAYMSANSFSVKLSMLLLLVLFGLYIINWLSTRRLVLRPLRLLQEKILAIMSNPHRLGEQVPIPHGRELENIFTNRF